MSESRREVNFDIAEAIFRKSVTDEQRSEAAGLYDLFANNWGQFDATSLARVIQYVRQSDGVDR